MADTVAGFTVERDVSTGQHLVTIYADDARDRDLTVDDALDLADLLRHHAEPSQCACGRPNIPGRDCPACEEAAEARS